MTNYREFIPITQQTSYDRIPYPGFARTSTHPDRLATLGRIFGMSPAAIETSRILEIGCGDGGNLIPIALGLPESRCVGFDLSGRAIEAGQETISILGLDNCDLRRMDIMEAGDGLGQFDYIIAHGVFSWIPREAQEKLLDIAKQYLAAHGIAFISYNTYPGWHQREMIRDMMRFHAMRFDDPETQTRQGRAILSFLAESAQSPNGSYRLVLEEERKEKGKYGDGYVFHDDLAQVNTPLYFHQFMERAAGHGLQYLGEADFTEMQTEIFDSATTDTLSRLASDSLLLKEQYMDFLKGRRFRQTLLCRDDVVLSRRLRPEAMKSFHVSATISLNEPAEASAPFKTATGVSFGMEHPLATAAMMALAKIRPLRFSFDTLLEESLQGLPDGIDPSSWEHPADLILGDILLSVYADGLAELHVHSGGAALDPGDRPAASPLARLQAASGATVTNLLHQRVVIEDERTRWLLTLLDGTRDVPEVVAIARLEIERDGKGSIGEPGEWVRQEIESFARSGLFL